MAMSVRLILFNVDLAAKARFAGPVHRSPPVVGEGGSSAEPGGPVRPPLRTTAHGRGRF